LVSGTNYVYPDKTVTAFSPKASLSYLPSDDWALRGSLGRGVRFPTVGELFKNFGITPTGSTTALTGAQIIAAGFPAPYNTGLTNDPNLRPETADSWEFSVERSLSKGMWRTSLFGEEKQDALISQSDVTTLPGYSISSVQNVDKVRTYGVEAALQLNDILVKGLDLSGSVAYIHARISENKANPGLVGTELPLIPDWRASMLGVYHATDALSYSLGWRYSGRQHSGLANPTTGQYPDPNPNTYGGRSSFSVFDVKLLYKVTKQWSGSVGIDNITNVKYFTLYPYAQRTLFAGLKFDY
jgi:iron complex outermembrane receptor protein